MNRSSPGLPVHHQLLELFSLYNFQQPGRTAKVREGPTRSGQISPFSHCLTWLQASIKQRKEATWALLQMWQRTPLGLLMLKPRPFPSPGPNCGIKGHLKVNCPNSPLGIWTSPPGPSRSTPTQLCPASLNLLLKTEGAQGPRTQLSSPLQSPG